MNHSQTRFILSLISFDKFYLPAFLFLKIIGTGLNDSFKFLLFSDTDVFVRTYPEKIFLFFFFFFSFFPNSHFSVLFPSSYCKDRVYFAFTSINPLTARALKNRPLSRGGHFVPMRLKKLCICTPSLVLNARLTVEKQSFLISGTKWPPREKGLHMTSNPPYWGSETMLKMAAILGRLDDPVELVFYVNPFLFCD